jgi:AcrR family transcriptional regulator
MSASGSAPPIHLAGEEVRGSGHICAFFRDQAEADGVLIPFVAEGLAGGDRVVRIVAAARREAYFSTLQGAGVDVGTALATARLRVEVWEDTYLRDGRFDQAAMLELVVGMLSEARARGFSRTRLVADMEWALRGPTAAQEVLEYEGRADRALRKLDDMVICSYHARQFGAPVVVDILATHPWALVGGTLKSTGGQARASARERILAAADRLFHADGIRATSVDAVIAAADVAKATLYRHFPTKDDLIVAWLEDDRPRWFEGVRLVAETRAGADKRLVPALLFDAVAEWLAAEDFRGCPYLNSPIEIADPAHPARAVIDAYLADIEAQLRSIVDDAGIVAPGPLAAQLPTLVAGSISLAVSRRTTAPVMAARDAAVRLLGAADSVR